jgi:hypothetical protein
MLPDLDKISAALDGLPLRHRLAALTYSVIVDPRATSAALNILEVALIIARHLSAEQRAAIAFELRLAAAELDTRLH